MDDLMNHELLQPAYISKVLDEIIPDTSEYALMTDVPLVTQETEQVIVDVRDNIGGMTQAVAAGAESPTVEYRGRSQFQFQPAEFREKTLLSRRDLQAIRKIGTASDLERAEERVAEIVGGLRYRLETRMEWCRWQMLFGELEIAQEDVQFTVDYAIPSDFTPVLTGTDRWSDIANSDPVDDMIEWAFLYRHEGIDPDFFMFNRYIEKLLLQNDKIRDLAEGNYMGTNNVEMNTVRLGDILKTFAGYPYKVYDKGYYFKMKLETPITPASTSFIVSENTGVVASDVVTVVHKNGSRYGQVNITVTPTGLSFAHSAIGGTMTFPAGSTVRIKKQFLPDDIFVIRGRIPPGTTGGTNFGEFVSVPSEYNGGLLNPQPGPFGKTVIDNDGDPPKAYILAGIRGLPVHYFPTCNVVADVL